MDNNSLSTRSSVQSTNTKISYFTKIREISFEETEELLLWIDKFDLSRPSKKLPRDFSDGLLMAEILKHLYPKIVDLHNYQSCSSLTLKMENWSTLNRKILRKISSPINYKTMELMSKGVPGIVESLLHDIMTKYRIYIERSRDSSVDSGDEFDNSDILTVNVSRKIDHQIVEVPQKMILYSQYEKLEDMLREKNQAIAILTQKGEHLENVVKMKQVRIDELTSMLASKKDRRLSGIIDQTNVSNYDLQHMDVSALVFDS